MPSGSNTSSSGAQMHTGLPSARATCAAISSLPKLQLMMSTASTFSAEKRSMTFSASASQYMTSTGLIPSRSTKETFSEAKCSLM